MTWLVLLAMGGLLGGVFLFHRYGVGLPDTHQLAQYQPKVLSRFYGQDGRPLGEYAHEKRAFVSLKSIPPMVRQAFISAEDKNFYHHPGIDITSIFAAILKNISHMGQSKRPVGASTITQQVIKNILLSEISHKVSIERKIKEAILSFRMEKALTKDRILEIYLNEVYLGLRAHGVAAAALNYFNKSLNELTLGECAFLGALPKAPSLFHPITAKKRTLARRNWVLKRMFEDKVITKNQMLSAQKEPILLKKQDMGERVKADFFAEEVRRDMIRRFGEKALYEEGLVVRTTLDSSLQDIAYRTLREGLENYDRRHGWRGPLKHIDLSHMNSNEQEEKILQVLQSIPYPEGAHPYSLAVVTSLSENAAFILLKNGEKGKIHLDDFRWARKWISQNRQGNPIQRSQDVFKKGDVILVKHMKDHEYSLRQIPDVSGALVAIEPHTGRVLAMQGGYSFGSTQFNRATQAMRQAGSTFKAFVYLAALQKGMSPASIVYDTPFSLHIGYERLWRPHNWDEKFMGPLTLRRSFELSRNVSTIRMVYEQVGMKNVVDLAHRMGVSHNMPLQLSSVLGATETTLMNITLGYGMLANGGRFLKPVLIDRIQDRHGKNMMVQEDIAYHACSQDPDILPSLKDKRSQIINPISASQMTSLLQGVIDRGTGRKLQSLNLNLAGKSGSTNNWRDAWFIGYSPDIVVGVYVGFDSPRTLGDREFGSVVAAPIFGEFMAQAMKDRPKLPFPMPKGARMMRVNSQTGTRAKPGDQNVIWEIFSPGTKANHSTTSSLMIDSNHESIPPSNESSLLDPTSKVQSPIQGTGGLY
jgi:penicillin-binding protein 1A